MAYKKQGEKKKWGKEQVLKLLFFVVFCYMAIELISVGVTLRQNQMQMAALESQIEEQTLNNANYEQMLEDKDSAEYMERRARESKSLDMAYPGEEIYYDTTDE